MQYIRVSSHIAIAASITSLSRDQNDDIVTLAKIMFRIMRAHRPLQAIVDLILYYDWKSVIYIYQSSEYFNYFLNNS